MIPRARRTVTMALLAAACLPSAAAADPRVIAAAGLPADPARDRAWQRFFAALPHGSELDSLTVVLAAPDDVTRRCGHDADGCYSGLLRQIVMPGVSGPGDSYTADIARHEYGHHLASQSDNAPFDSSLGTKRWFTHERICERLRSGELADDPATSYERSPAEGFAEAYRVTAGGDPHRWIVDPGLFPEPAARRAILADVRHPWAGGRERRFSGRLSRERRQRSVTVRVPLDGTVRIRATASKSMGLSTTLSDGRWRRAGGTRLRYVDCGRRSLRLTVRARRGSGRFGVSAFVP